jgi:hypothetical protein
MCTKLNKVLRSLHPINLTAHSIAIPVSFYTFVKMRSGSSLLINDR